jgi:hypothetical protein
LPRQQSRQRRAADQRCGEEEPGILRADLVDAAGIGDAKAEPRGKKW